VIAIVSTVFLWFQLQIYEYIWLNGEFFGKNLQGKSGKSDSKIVVGEIISLSLQDEAQCFALIFVNYE